MFFLPYLEKNWSMFSCVCPTRQKHKRTFSKMPFMTSQEAYANMALLLFDRQLSSWTYSTRGSFPCLAS